MYTVKFWHSLSLLRYKVVGTLLFTFFSVSLLAQDGGTNMLDHDDNKYYFGIIISGNSSQYRIFHSDIFTNEDSVRSANPKWNGGASAGITANLRITQHTALRLAPQFVFATKSIEYDFKEKRDTTLTIESILLHAPLSFKFSSDRIANFRFYALAGIKYDYDFNSNVRSRRNDEILKIRPTDFGYDIGVGFDFYYPNYILSPEVKISNGIGNIHKTDNAILTNKIFETINTRAIYFGVTIGG
jgi:hypothetical protein